MKTEKISLFFPLFLAILLLGGCSKNDNLSYSNSRQSHSTASVQSNTGEKIQVNNKELNIKNADDQEITVKNGNIILKNGEEKMEISKDAIGNSVKTIKQNDNGIDGNDPMMKLLMN